MLVRRRIILHCALLMHSAAAAGPPLSCAMKSPVKSDETVTLYTTAAWPSPLTPGAWEIEIHGVIFEKETRPLLSLAMKAALKIDTANLPESSRKLLKERIALFMVDNERSKSLPIKAGSTTHLLPPSEPNGHFRHTLTLTAEEFHAAKTDSGIPLTALTPQDDPRTFTGNVCVIPNNGRPLVISDIDDTIKVTSVRDRMETKLNTFCRPFQPVEGMAAVYRQWEERSAAQFCYVTGSPWQLYAPLEAFRETGGFPSGPWHMKHLRLTDPETVKAFLSSHNDYKLEAIEPMLARWPSRPVILVGDSGEQDPEIYGHLARRNPGRIAAVFIRNVTDSTRGDERFRKAFAGVGDSLWRLFISPSELPPELH